MKGRLLIVDDERGIVIALKGLFSKEGYEVETAESGEEALEKVKAAPFHVIITDLSMKGMSGLDLLRAVRQLDRGVRGADDHRLRLAADRGRRDEGRRRGLSSQAVRQRRVAHQGAQGDGEAAPAAALISSSASRPRARPAASPTWSGGSLAMVRVLRDHRQGRADRCDGADSRRIGNRQGTGREGDPLPKPARAKARSSRSIARRSRASWSRANSSVMRRAPSPARSRGARESSRRPKAARCSSTKSAT